MSTRKSPRQALASAVEKAKSPPALPDYATMDLNLFFGGLITQIATERGIPREDVVAAMREIAGTASAEPEALPAEPEPGKVRIRVRGPQAGRRRLGRTFTPEPQDFDVSEADELPVLQADTELTVKIIG